MNFSTLITPARRAFSAGSSLAARAAGQANRIVRSSRGPKSGMDDATLARKVETELFRRHKAVKGKVDVNAADGIVSLHGEARTPALVKELETFVATVPEVRGVENHLHLPKTPAPTRADSPGRARKSRSSSSGATRRPAKRAPANAERAVPGAEPGPRELAAEGRGRGPAPLGSRDEENR